MNAGVKKSFSIIVVAEGDEEGGAYKVAEGLKKEFPEIDTRVSILGHIQRGGNPTANDRVLATRLGAACVEALLKGEAGKMAGVLNNQVVLTPFSEAIKNSKPLPDILQLLQYTNV
ncbi:6-phosphofructokinase [Oscillatoria amoena NRMC-F 0135]|nr:6-phosphofructokinase [Oscillatoria amoena NRMC-F 0135]